MTPGNSQPSPEQLLRALIEHMRKNQQTPNAPVSDRDFQSFFEPNGSGGVAGLDRMRDPRGSYHFNTPAYQETQNTYNMPEFDSLFDPTWNDRYPTNGYY
jgi:hypothetical protein